MRTLLLTLLLLAAPLVVAAPAAAAPTVDPDGELGDAEDWANCALDAGTDNLALPCGTP